MANARSPGKMLIGAKASPELWRAVDAWLDRNAPATVTDFVIRAALDKLKADGIPVDELEAQRDGRARRPVKYTIRRQKSAEFNDE